jgi:hypothetical protein
MITGRSPIALFERPWATASRTSPARGDKERSGGDAAAGHAVQRAGGVGHAVPEQAAE